MDLFAPAANGLILQRGYQVQPEAVTETDESEIGSKRVTAVAERVARRYTLEYRSHTREGYEYAVNFHRRQRGEARVWQVDAPELVPSPDFAPTVEAVSGGTQPQQDITVGFTWEAISGQTLLSPTALITVPANNLLKVTLDPYPPNITLARIYAVDGAGTPQDQVQLTNERVWTQPDAPLLVATSNPPSASPVRRV